MQKMKQKMRCIMSNSMKKLIKKNLENPAPSSTFVENKDLVTKFVRK